MGSSPTSGNGCVEIQRCINGITKTQPKLPFSVFTEIKFDSVISHPSLNESCKRIIAACKHAILVFPLFPYISDEPCQIPIHLHYEFIEIWVAKYWNDKRNTDFCAPTIGDFTRVEI